MKQMLKRKDGSYSQRGLWDNIRANKGSGKAPTKEMLKQEKKIKMSKMTKAQKGKTVKSGPTYKNLKMGVKNEYYEMTGENRDITPSSRDSARYRGGYEQGLKGMKGMKGEGNVEKMGRWEGQNVKKKGKTGVSIKKKMQAGGVAGKQPKAGMVDPKGAYTKVQMRTLGNMKKGGKISKKTSKKK
jgi:hypothetical protein